MSAIAFIITPDKAHLYSDGRSVSDKEPAKDNRQKVHKINSHTAMIHAGAWREGVLQKVIKEAGKASNLQEITANASDLMARELGDIDYETLSDNPHENSALWILSYEHGEPELMSIEGKKKFKPEPIPIDSELLMVAMVYGCEGEDNPFIEYLEEYYSLMKDFEQAGYQAFYRMIDDYKHTGKVNGNIYQESIAN